ncbi:MAG: hypothetical protein SFU98_11765 [Leptospiraceae bacterium]|nr:hypothetical protein [Leptospiraceae bacterium]
MKVIILLNKSNRLVKIIYSPLALSCSQVHDRSDEGSSFTSRQVIPGNDRWIARTSANFIGGGWFGPIPTQRMWNKTFERESNALYNKDRWGQRTSGRYGDATNVIAHVSAAGTITGDWLANRAGTALFGSANIVNKYLETREYVLKELGFDIKPLNNFYRFRPPNLSCKNFYW